MRVTVAFANLRHLSGLRKTRLLPIERVYSAAICNAVYGCEAWLMYVEHADDIDGVW